MTASKLSAEPDRRDNVEPEVRDAMSVGIASAVVPGLGQMMQRRYGAAALQFTSLAVFAGAAFALGAHSGWAAAAALNVWSVIDAVLWARGSGDDPGAHTPGNS